MEYDWEDFVAVHFDGGHTFTSTGHYPFIAGYTTAGEPLYSAYLSIPGKPSHVDVAIPNGVRLENIRIKLHYADGSTTLTKPYGSISIYALRYDPSAYDLSEYYSSKVKEAGGMDATGPFSWKSIKKLPDPRPDEQLSVDEASIRAPKMLWVEVLFEFD